MVEPTTTLLVTLLSSHILTDALSTTTTGIIFFYVHLATMFNRVAIVVLIAYEIVAVGERVNPLPGESIEQMVLKRTITMLVGIGTALMFNWYVAHTYTPPISLHLDMYAIC